MNYIAFTFRRGACLVFLLVGIIGGVGWAGLGPQNTLVVVNGDSWASQAVANEFIAARDIPALNVVYLHLRDLPDFEQIDVDTFRARIMQPVFAEIESRGLGGHISCITYSSDIPYAVRVNSDIGQRKLPPIITPVASVNGLTYLYQLVKTGEPNYLALNANRYAPPMVAPPPAENFTPEQRQEAFDAIAAIRDKDWARAEPLLVNLVKAYPDSYMMGFHLACCLARQNKLDEAMGALNRAVEAGFWNTNILKQEEAFTLLRERPDFQELLHRVKSPPIAAPDPVGFESTSGWNADGTKIPGRSDMGYMLSTMLGITSGRGNSVAEVREALRRSAGADGTSPKGTIYYMVNGDVRSTTRQWGFAAAVAKLKQLGVNAEAAGGSMPMRKGDVAGAMLGTAGFNWKQSGSTILPGAICEHLTSTGGVMVQSGGQTPISEWVRYGAAGTSGTVTEPYSLQPKFPTPFVHVYYAQGCTLAESFYLAVAAPYQLLILGDPMCRPWGKIPTVSVPTISKGAVVRDAFEIKPVVTPSDFSVARYELYVDGRRQGVWTGDRTVICETSKLGDGYHKLRVVAVGADPIQSQGWCDIPIRVDNSGRQLSASLVGNEDRKVIWSLPVTVSASLPGASRILFYHNGNEVGRIDGAQGQASIDTRLMGMGPVSIQTVGFVDAGNGQSSRIAAEPILVEVVPPPFMPAATIEAGNVARGLLLRYESGGKAVVLDTGTLADRLSRLAPVNGDPFVLEGYFDVPADDVYQFQVRVNGRAAIEVDKRPLDATTPNAWNYLPVSLSAGTHFLYVRLECLGKPRIDIRFGAAGVRTIQPDQFRFVAGPQ